MASVITRDIWVNDSGTAAAPVGDGTVLQNSVLQNHIYARVDAMFAGAGAYATLELGGLLKVDGFGTSQFIASGSGAQAIRVQNTAAGTTNFTSIQAGNDAAADATSLFASSSTYTATGDLAQDATLLRGNRPGGVTISALNAAGVIRFFTNNPAVEAGRFTAAQYLGIGTTAPAYQVHISGAGQATADLTDAGSTGAAIVLQDTGAGAGAGGAVVFGAVGATKHFAAIKGFLTDGSANTSGQLTIATRQLTSDTALTRALTIYPSGGVAIGQTAGIVDPSRGGLFVEFSLKNGGNFAIGGAHTETTWPFSQNDYNVGLYAVDFISSSAAVNLTGMVPTINQQIMTLGNAGTFNITITHNDPASTAGNRFFFKSHGNYVLAPDGMATFLYASAQGVWRLLID
jgi:hypothetical protein